jgi:predicted NUDIX family NTP pyrophosphohydrolase
VSPSDVRSDRYGRPRGRHEEDAAHRAAVSGAGKPMRRSAGIVLFRLRDGVPEVLLGHMGGPFWRRKDAGAWTIPKGGYPDEEDPLEAARREYAEEIGHPVPDGELIPLGAVMQANGKLVTAWAVQGDLDPASAVSNTFELEWPPNSGRRQTYPELDRVAWFTLDAARSSAVAAQAALFDRLDEALKARRPAAAVIKNRRDDSYRTRSQP